MSEAASPELHLFVIWSSALPLADRMLADMARHLEIVWQSEFAIDRNDFREQPFLQRHWSYRMLFFAHHPMMAGHGWNDVGMMLFYAWNLSAVPRALELREKLRSMTKTSTFPVTYGRLDVWRMRWALLCLRICRLFAHSGGKAAALDTRIARAKAFLKHDCGLWHKVLYG